MGVCAPGPEARQSAEDTGAPRKWEVMSAGTLILAGATTDGAFQPGIQPGDPDKEGLIVSLSRKRMREIPSFRLVFVEGLLSARHCPRRW